MPADEPVRPTAPRRSRRRSFGGWLIRLGARLGGQPADLHEEEPPPSPADDPAADIVDQAEAFQSVRVVKPAASRSASSELYYFCEGLRRG